MTPRGLLADLVEEMSQSDLGRQMLRGACQYDAITIGTLDGILTAAYDQCQDEKTANEVIKPWKERVRIHFTN